MTRIGDLAGQNQTLYYLAQLQARTASAQQQISTNLKADRYQGIATDAPRVTSLENAATRARQFVDSNNQLFSRLKQTEDTVKNVNDLVLRARNDLLSAMSRETFDPLLLSGALNTLQEVAGALNSTDGSRYVFAGSRTDTQPVNLAGLPALGIFLLPAETYYYQGDSQILNARVSQDVSIDYGVTANEMGFQNAIQGLHMVATVDLTVPATVRPTLDAALAFLNQALNEIPDIVGRVGQARRTIEGNIEQHDAFILGAEAEITRLQYTDVTEVATRLSADRNTLEASYASLATLRSLSLVNFIR
jgi:flagellar hook-associated protein 3 FlgL